MTQELVRPAVVCHWGALRIWPERGLVHIEDTRDHSYTSVSVRTMLERLQGMSDMLRNSRQAMRDAGVMDFHHYDQHLRQLEQLVEVCRVAQQQGTPDDPQARQEHLRRRPKLFVPEAVL